MNENLLRAINRRQKTWQMQTTCKMQIATCKNVENPIVNCGFVCK